MGAARPDSLFEIGSITKTFTGLILAQVIAQGKVWPDEPVSEVLPPGIVSKPAGREITLLGRHWRFVPTKNIPRCWSGKSPRRSACTTRW
jgi:hypothetical protein